MRPRTYITNLLYGSTEAEPISTVSAEEKMELEGTQCVGHCVGRPVFKGSVKVIKIEPVLDLFGYP